MEGICKNCSEIVNGKFCTNCGQKTSVRRYSIMHFIKHDLISGIWSVDNAIFFTIKELFTRPGHGIREFINGKRVKYFNVITLLLIILAISHFAGAYTQVKLSDLVPDISKESMNGIERFTREYPKSILILTIPIYSFFSLLWFRKSKLNLTEHFVLNSYKTVAELILALMFTIITIFYTGQKGLLIVYGFVSVVSIIYTLLYYYQFFSDYGYSKKSLMLRTLGVVFSYQFFYMLAGFIVGISFSGT